VQKGDIISRDTNTRWTIYAMKDAIDNANIYIHVQLNPFEAAAIVDYIFNRGIGNFLSTQLDELINANPKDPRIKAEIIGTGLKDRLGHIWWGLGRRRRAEAYLYVTGNIKLEWPRWSTPTF
jgi:GH24 family phage-related lysozyme (muramidase)